jgi:hypothetical protein
MANYRNSTTYRHNKDNNKVQIVPVLALISSRTLDFRESKCLFRGHAILMGIDNYKQSW